ncbi:unnamed protein product, partial [Rhizoctonia solani]
MKSSSIWENLARLKSRWKRRLHVGSDDTYPVSPVTHEIPEIPKSGNQATASAGRHTRAPSVNVMPIQADGHETNPAGTIDGTPWSGTQSMLPILESSAPAFGPLKLAINQLRKVIDKYDDVGRGSREYGELRTMIEALVNDFTAHMEHGRSIEPAMTRSITLFGENIQEEIRIMETTLASRTGRRLLYATGDSEEIIGCYRRIRRLLERLLLNVSMDILRAVNAQTMETRLNGMSPAKSARYNTAEVDGIGRNSCTPGTRNMVIDRLLEWARDPEAGSVFWINGMAGTGKTTIAYTFCERLENAQQLGASFFCSHMIPESCQIKNIIPTVSYQLARYSLNFSYALLRVLELKPDAHTFPLKDQYRNLIVEPLMEVRESLPNNIILVIDGLDECENENGIGQFLDVLLSATYSQPLPIRILLSSRPERTIYGRIMGQRDATQLVLDEIYSGLVKADIEAYMRQELSHIPLTDSQWSNIIQQCGILFIYAAVACRYLKQAHEVEALDEAVNVVIGSNFIAMEREGKLIDKLYSRVLINAFDGYGKREADRTIMKSILETAICAMEPMSVEAIASVLHLGNTKRVEALLRPLRSVLKVTESTGLVTTLHASFCDFLLFSERSPIFNFDQEKGHTAIATACLKIIDATEPKFNICQLPSSYLSDDEVEDLDLRVNQAITPGLLYACHHWSTHLYLGKNRGEVITSLVHNFFSARLLLWMEIINLTKRMRFGTSIIHYAEKWCKAQAMPEDLAKMAHDAWQFVSIYANHPISRSTPHIYVSMLPFWPHYRPISEAYMPRIGGMVQPSGTAMTEREIALLGTWKASGEEAHSISLSVDGARLAVATGDSIDLIETSTGECLHQLSEQRTKDVRLVAISPDGTRIIFGSHSSTLYLW